MQNFKVIEEKFLSISSFVKNVEISKDEKGLVATLYPDFEELQKSNIINIESELRWYAIEVYNFEVEDKDRIISYKIVSHTKKLEDDKDIDSEDYALLKSFLAELSGLDVFLHSHLELDLGLDSIDYVELFIFIEQSFGIVIDEKIFASMMNTKELYEYIEKNKQFRKISDISLKDILQEPINEKVEYSPWIMCLYKTVMFPLFKIYFRLEVKGYENIPKSECIIAPSHQSMLDGFLIEATLPYKILKNSFFLAYKNVFGTKVLKPIADNGQTLLIDANENLKRTMQQCALPLRKKSNLVIFPEGARSRDRDLLEFRPFFAMLSKIYNVPVVPVVIDGSFEALRSGRSFPKPCKIKIKYLEPIFPDNLSVEEIVEKTKNEIDKEMKLNSVLI